MSNVENLVSESRLLVNRLRENEAYADTLISEAHHIKEKLNAMKQYEEDLNKLNDIPKRKPRHELIMEIAQESRQVRDLKSENLELKACLDEHQTALEIIMNKYREQMRQFMMTKKLEDSILKVLEASNCSEGAMREKICEMVTVMRTAASLDDATADKDSEKLTQLLTENKGLKEMLKIHHQFGVELQQASAQSQGEKTTPTHSDRDIDDDATPASSDVEDST